jgi:hypothetical protein
MENNNDEENGMSPDPLIMGKGSMYPLVNPVAWMKCPPPSDKETMEVLMIDAANMFCVLNPVIATIMFFSWALIGIRIPVFFHGFWGFATLVFLFVVHYWLIKWYPCLKKINKFFALFLVKIIPVFISSVLCSGLISLS